MKFVNGFFHCFRHLKYKMVTIKSQSNLIIKMEIFLSKFNSRLCLTFVNLFILILFFMFSNVYRIYCFIYTFFCLYLSCYGNMSYVGMKYFVLVYIQYNVNSSSFRWIRWPTVGTHLRLSIFKYILN